MKDDGEKSRTTTRTVLGTLVAALTLIAFSGQSTSGALIGKITNASSTTQSSIISTERCRDVANSFSPYLIWPLDETSGTTATDVSGNNRPGTYRDGYTFGQAGPCPRDNGRSTLFNGSTGYVSTTSTTPIAGPNTFSIVIWFRTTSSLGGRLIGFGGSQTGISSNYDRHIYMINDGRVIFGVNPPNSPTAILSTSEPLNDGRWHQVVGTVSASGMTMYADGKLISSFAGATSGEVYSGYWRVGGDNLYAWPGQPTSRFPAASLAGGMVFTNALTAGEVDRLWRSGL